ncbi:class I SAM-dependent methyltransferase [Maridesulfovibrio hydrothermalis]|uniref:Putative Methyltransferase type 12 n=1 Tax=Maridesulfovibrio hydrothermalis AM13 = DSM 14728 TaxID=1121451 RepID=L0R7X1_9BACT|nr:class I SAM-dependent methyltransferase [Maridesulfovibrio hydrothermalis]CCO22295.1 putative Methyltransferase type 12 [Maridesulfovibrio hydrothermalis AM13 = DSM 14728]
MAAIYDQLASIYDAWSQADPADSDSVEFYKKLGQSEQGIIVELGVGTGRIALELAVSGKNIIGIDISDNMLGICQDKARELGVSDRIHLITNDIREFDLPEPADLIYLPFRTVGHLLNQNDRLKLFRSVYRNLNVGGRFVFDHYMFSEHWAKSNERKQRLMCVIPCENKKFIYVHDIYLYDYENQIMDCRIIVENVDEVGLVTLKRYIAFSFSWVTIAQIQELINEVGFEVDDMLGEFNGNKWTEQSENQIWVLRKTKK